MTLSASMVKTFGLMTGAAAGLAQDSGWDLGAVCRRTEVWSPMTKHCGGDDEVH